MKSHRSNRSGPRECFACPELFVEIINCEFSAETCQGSAEGRQPGAGPSVGDGLGEPQVGNTPEEPAESDPRWAASALGPSARGHSVLGKSFVPSPSFSVPHWSQRWALHPPLQLWSILWSFSHLFPVIPDLQPAVTSPHSCFLQSQA